MRRLLLSLLVACHTPGAADPVVPRTFAVTDPADATPSRDPLGPRLISEERARVPPPSASVLHGALEPCAPPAPPTSPAPTARFEPEISYLSDAEVSEGLARETKAASAPPGVHCHFYLGQETQLHLGVRGGEATRAQLASFELSLSFRLDPYEGSSFVLEIARQRMPLLRSAHPISLASPPVAPTCGGPGFTGWLHPSPQLSAFCDAVR